MARTSVASPTRSACADSASCSVPGTRDQVGSDQGQEALPEIVDQVAGQLLGAESGRRQMGHRHQGPADVPLGQGLDDLVELGQVVVDRVGGDHLVEHGQRVAGRSPAPAHGQVQRLVGHVEVGVPRTSLEQLAERLGAEQPELEVLGPAADGGQHLLRVGGGQHEDHVGGRLLQRLQQGVGRRRRQHVDLVDDVDLLAARGPEGGPGHQVAHGLHPVVGGRVELVDVERGALGDLDAGGADAAGLAVAEIGAVEGLGQDPGRRRLAGPPGPAEEVGVGHPAVPDGVAEGQDHVVLAPHLAERGRPESPVQRLVGSLVGCRRPRRGAYRAPAHRAGPGARCDGQVDCGTRPDPLRAAAFRP